MQTVFKYTLDEGVTKVDMYEGAKVLVVKDQKDQVCLWAQVDTSKPLSERIFEVFGTGHEQSYNVGISREYLGTAFLFNECLVLHVYEYTGA